MLTNKDIDVIRICLKTTLAITNGDTEGAEKGRKDIKATLRNFNEFINEFEDEQREFEDYSEYLE